MITVGSDPEVFVKSSAGIIPVIGLLGGTKNSPRPVELGAVQEDNVLAEFNITPARTAKEFVNNINHVMEQLAGLLGNNKYEIKSWHSFRMRELSKYGPAAHEFGCDPDFNCWTGTQNPPPNRDRPGLRTAAGHIHVGGTKHSPDVVAKIMDICLGVPSIIYDTDPIRRIMYGKAGAYRPKPYGMEYRVLSNFWLKTDTMKEWVFNTTVWAESMADNLDDFIGMSGGEDNIINAINNSDVDAAKKIVSAIGVQMA